MQCIGLKQNIEIRAVLQIVADFADLNLVASDAVTGAITLRLKDVPWDQALDIVLRTNGLDKRVPFNRRKNQNGLCTFGDNENCRNLQSVLD